MKLNFIFLEERKEKKPHLHFKDANRIGAIRLDIASYFPHGNPLKYTDKLTKREVKIFAKLFTDGIYKQACELWNLLPDTLKLDGKNKPNYLTLR